MVTFVPRSELGWPPSAAPEQLTAYGVKIHYEGTHVSIDSHDECVEEVKAIRRSHLANTTENYSDIAYNLLACRHGYVFEGRGRRKRTGANGNQELNRGHYAICGLLGDSGDTEPTPEMIEGIKWGITYLRQDCTSKDIGGHRDGYATSCPGEPLWRLVQNGGLEPDGSPPPKPSPIYAPFPGSSFFRLGKQHPLILAMGKALVREGYSGYSVGPSSTFERGDIKAYAWWQRKLGYSGSDADGYPGKSSWDKLKVAQS